MLLTLVLSCLFLASACGKDDSEQHQHEFKWTIVTEATCTEKGSMEGICSTCGKKEYDDIAVKNHEYAWGIEKQPTCLEKGKMVAYCANCQDYQEREIEKKAHTYENDVCTTCSQKKNAVYLAQGQKLGYTFSDMDKIATDKGFIGEYVVSSLIGYYSGLKIKDFYINGTGELEISTPYYSFNVGDYREEFAIESDEVPLIASVEIGRYLFNDFDIVGVQIKVILVDGSTSTYRIYEEGNEYFGLEWEDNGVPPKVYVSTIAINMQNELLLVMNDREVIKVGKIPEKKLEIDSSVLQYRLSNESYSVESYSVCGVMDRNVTEIEIPSTHKGLPVKKIDFGAFNGMEKLEKVKVGKNVVRIEERAFAFCKALKTIAFEENSNLTSIEDEAFANCSSLQSITLPNNLTSIGDSAFSNCTSLQSIAIPEKVKQIDWDAFYNCTSLESVTLNNSVKTINSYAFQNCTSLQKITIPESVEYVSQNAFIGCTSLVIYCEVSEKPETWNASWNKLDFNNNTFVPVGWGYKG